MKTLFRLLCCAGVLASCIFTQVQVRGPVRMRGSVNLSSAGVPDFLSSNYGTFGDAHTVSDAVTVNGSTALTSATGFTGCAIGMTVHVAGPSTGPLLRTVSACAANTITMSSGASTSQPGLSATYGHPDTTPLQNAINAAATAGRRLRIQAVSGKYFAGPLTIPSNSNIAIEAGVVIRALSGFIESQTFVSIEDVSNISIVGLGAGARIEMPRLEYTDGEHRHCMGIRGVTTALIDHITCAGSGGDGFYIGRATGHPQNVTIRNCVGDDNRRQGLSLISGINITIQDSTFSNTVGTDPQYGIDIEPNSTTDLLQGIVLTRVTTTNNAGAGIGISLFPLDNTSANVDIAINDSTDNGSAVALGFQCNWASGTAGVGGLVTVDNYTATGSTGTGFFFKAYQQSCAHVDITNSTLTNVSVNGGYAIMFDRTSGGTETMGNVTFNNLTITDSRFPNGIVDYISQVDGSGFGFANIVNTNPHFSGAG